MTGNAPGTNAQDTYEFTNTNKWDTRQLVTMALMCAIGVLLSFVEFPLLPGVTWLKYDAHREAGRRAEGEAAHHGGHGGGVVLEPGDAG